MRNDSKTGRRAFLRGTSVAIPAALVPAAAQAASVQASSDDAAAIRKLYQDYAARLAGGAAEGPSPVQLRLLNDPAQPPDAIAISADGRSATARFHCLAQVAAPFTGNDTLVQMARLQGQYKATWWESGVYSLECVKTGGAWKIQRLAYRRAAGAGQLSV